MLTKAHNSVRSHFYILHFTDVDSETSLTCSTRFPIALATFTLVCMQGKSSQTRLIHTELVDSEI